jgi:hypothetical protein
LRVAEFDIQATPNRYVTAYPIGDLHVEKITFDEARFKRYVKTIAEDPNGFWVFVGDAVEGRTPDMAKYDPDIIYDVYKNSDYLFRVQSKLEELFKPLRDRPGVVVKGNHDEYQKWAGISNYLASISGGFYLDGEGLFRVNADLGGKTRSLIGYARHIVSGGSTPGAKLNAASKLGSLVEADMYFAGHIHNHASHIYPNYTLPRRGNLQLISKDKATFIATSFLTPRVEGVVDYSGRKGYGTTDTGLLVLDIDCENMKFYRREMRF